MKSKLVLPKLPVDGWDVFFTFLQFAMCVVAVSWTAYERLPAPGWSVACIALAAAIMSIHASMGSWQKFTWIALMALLLAIELRAISKDRWDSDEKSRIAQKEQEEQFQQVRQDQDVNFNATTGRLESVAHGLQQSLNATNRTMRQTQPHAVISFQPATFVAKPIALQSDVPYEFNFYYTNRGNETASDVKFLGAAYIGDTEDTEAQQQLAARFELEWQEGNHGLSNVLSLGKPEFSSISKAFSADDLRRLSGKGTIYLLGRIEYRDQTGYWRTQICESFVKWPSGKMGLATVHPCQVFLLDRVPAKRHQNVGH